MKKSIKRVFWLISLLFFMLIMFMTKTVIWDSRSFITNPYNPRLNYDNSNIQRGSIKSQYGTVIAYSEFSDNKYERYYPYGSIGAHIIGYVGVGKAGLEASENFELQKLHNEVIQRLKNTFSKTPLIGNSVVTTIDMELQKKADSLLGTNKGAIVAMESSTGKILAMTSYPNYNPASVAVSWDSLINDDESPLLNRATQGLYPPGSTFKLITALAGIRAGQQNFEYECKGEAEFDGKVIHCFDNKKHGNINMSVALAQSCNCYFAQLAYNIGAEQIRNTADMFGFNSSTEFLLQNSISSVLLEPSSSKSELVESAIGQGKTLATPLFMCMIASSIQNNGIMMKPYIVDHIEYSNGKSSGVVLPQTIRTVMTLDESKIIKEMMEGVVSSGTGAAASVSGATVGGKTGTAENSSGSDHSWFIGYAEKGESKISVAVLLDEAGSKKATPIAGKLIDYIVNKY